MSKSKKIVIKFDSHNAPIIKCKNCVQSDLNIAGSKLLANAKKLPKTQKISTFKRLFKAVKYAVSTTSVDKQGKYYKE